jgi:glycosyltransferase involved in cell wall biosynthesis
MPQNVCVLIPALNEELTIATVIGDFHKQLPDADVVVINNNSTDQTVNIAKKAGARILYEKKPGKGNAVRKAFAELDADIYVMVDADDTYPANMVSKMIKAVNEEKIDMVIGTRLENFKKEEKKFLHNFGNNFFVWLLNLVFHSHFKDIFSGYRVFSREFVKNTPLLSEGFEIESELTVQALERGYKVKEIPIEYRERPKGSHSKLRTFNDGWKILLAIFSIFRDYRPMTFFTILACFFLLLGLIFGSFVIIDYVQKGIVTRVPFAILTTLLIIVGCICFIGGFIVSAVNRRFAELNEIRRIK